MLSGKLDSTFVLACTFFLYIVINAYFGVMNLYTKELVEERD